MSNKRTEMHRLQELVRLHRMGTGARAVARLLEMSPNTERRYREELRSANLLEGSPDELPDMEALKGAILQRRPLPATVDPTSSIDLWLEQINGLLDAGLQARAIYDRLRLEESEFCGSYWAVKRMVRRLRRARGVQAKDVAIIVDTAPGKVAQVDFGYVGKLLDPEQHVLRRAWVFVMVLGHSRHMFCKVVFDQQTTTWLQLHIEAFKYFGGCVETVVPDNLKAAVLRNAFATGGDTALNRSYRELARHYGFKIDPTPPYSPKKKGKVESAVKYVKNNALKGRGGENINEVNIILSRWVEEIAGTRIHGTTHKPPLDLFKAEEAPTLLCLPGHRFEALVWKKAKVHQDAHVEFDRRLYSIPWRFIGKDLWLRCTAHTLIAYSDDTRVATHSRNFRGRRSTKPEHLPEHRRDWAHRSEDYWINRAAHIGDESKEIVREILGQDDVLSHLRNAQAVVQYLEGFPVSRAEAAAKRARYYGTLTYRGIKAILMKALDLEPLPIIAPQSSLSNPTYARNLREMLEASTETDHEPH